MRELQKQCPSTDPTGKALTCCNSLPACETFSLQEKIMLFVDSPPNRNIFTWIVWRALYVKTWILTQKWPDHLLLMTSYLVTIVTDHHQTCFRTRSLLSKQTFPIELLRESGRDSQKKYGRVRGGGGGGGGRELKSRGSANLRSGVFFLSRKGGKKDSLIAG